MHSRADTLDPMSVPAAALRGCSATHRLQAKHPPAPFLLNTPLPEGRTRDPQGRVDDGDARLLWHPEPCWRGDGEETWPCSAWAQLPQICVRRARSMLETELTLLKTFPTD